MSLYFNQNFLLFYFRENGEVATAFAYLMAEMWLGEFECISPEVFCSVIGDRCPAFTKKTQQDAQEFLIYVLNELHEALKKVRPHLGPSGAVKCQCTSVSSLPFVIA